MKRVASLYLPNWSIDRIRRAERQRASPPEAEVDASTAIANVTGWRPGARWARQDVERPIGYRRSASEDGGVVASRSMARAKVSDALITVHKIGGRIEIAAISPEASMIGLSPGIALTNARASVLDLRVHDTDPEGDRADLERLAITLARRWCPVVTISNADGLFLDLTGVAHLRGGEEAMARRIVGVLARLGVSARIAVADTAGAAWALARFALSGGNDGQVYEKGRHVSALAPLPVAALRLDDRSIDLLRRLGIDCIGELLDIPRAPLVRRFGGLVTQRIDQALGAASEPLDPVIPAKPIAVIRRFSEPIGTAEAIYHWLEGLIGDLVSKLVEHGQGARMLMLVAERVDRTTQTIRIGLSKPIRDSAHILRLIARRIEEIDPGCGIDALSLHVCRADPLGPETLGARLAEEQATDLALLVDTLANRIGAARLWRCRAIESDVPERSIGLIPPLKPEERGAPALKLDDVRRLDTRDRNDAWHPRWPRPARLLSRPEPIDHVIAELPDQPPRRFTWRGTTHRIVRADGPERIVGEWWRNAAEACAVRDYFQVEDEAGRRFWLFRRGDGVHAESGDLSWHMHGAFG